MTSFPVPLDNLITYVQGLHPDGGPLDSLSDAVTVSAQLDEQADALLGHFVDRARRSGASWSQIGTAMGVSKQAAQKRFVPRWDGSDPVLEWQSYSRFTLLARNALVSAGRIGEHAGADRIDAAHLAAGLLSAPQGLAAKIIHGAGIGDEQVYAAFHLAPVPGTADADPTDLSRLRFTDDAKAALKGTLRAALRLGHNYIGTEHLLLGILFAEDAAASTLGSLGLSVELVENVLAVELAAIQRQRRTG
jgi:hypothetical protein